MSTEGYTQPPPGYAPPKDSKPDNKNYNSISQNEEIQSAGPSQMPDGDLPDDFKYGATISECVREVRMASVRKIYTILTLQLLATFATGFWVSYSQSMQTFILKHPNTLFVPIIGSFVTLGLTYWQRHKVPANFALLSSFTACEALAIGAVISTFENKTIVLQALLCTAIVFIGLTAFTFQSKYDFSGLAPILSVGIFGMIGFGLVGLFVPFSSTVSLVYGIIGVALFSLYVVYDTHQIFNRLSPDEYILASISLYLDFLNYPPFVYREGITPEKVFGGVDGKKYEVIADLFDIPLEKAKQLAIEPPFYCDHGVFIEFKGSFFCNYNTTILDCAKVSIGNRVSFGPNVSIYAATHSVDVGERLEDLERAYPVEIGDDTWVGGSVNIICSAKGTKIGRGCTIAAGTTLWGTFPDNVVIAGNPPKIIKHLEPSANE
ncbi:hypothetical protein E3P94_00273 [Wallemia ichthyophaga]|nr:hypothetical protein E3P98_00076 [Wallemia ichthyophaga]TIB04275.1 hypothetical protein E3P95_00273 [Wallemia ichthyophaga]TIB05445.1 hypothetical protein E3P94_00273 [Wallemia ichthyophaga]